LFKLENSVQNQVLLETLVRTCDDAIFVIDTSGVIELFNPAAEKLFKTPKHDAIGASILTLLPALSNGAHHNGFNAQHIANLITQVEVQTISVNQMEIPILLNLNEMKVGSELKYTVIIRDLSGLDNQNRKQLGEREMFDAIIEAAVDGIIVIDPEGYIRKINPAVCRMFDYTQNELLGAKINKLMPMEDASNHDRYMADFHRTGKAKIIGIGREVYGKRKNGSIFPFKLSVSEVSLSGERRYAGIIHDLSEQKRIQQKLEEYARELESHVENRTREIRRVNEGLRQQIREKTRAEKALMESQGLYQAVASNFPDGTIIVLDNQLKYVFAEGLELKRKKKNQRSLIGTSYIGKFETEDQEEVALMCTSVLSGLKQKLEIQIGKEYYILSAVPLANQNSQIDRILVVEKNITHQKKAEEDIQKALEKERELNILKSRFVSMASHEFRTPLSTVLSSVTLAERYVEIGNTEKQRKHFERIKNSVHNLTNILNDFLSLDKLETGRIQITVEEMDLHDLIVSVTDEIGDILKKGQHIEVNSKGPLIISTDPKLLKNIMINLLSNASKYSDEGRGIWIKVLEETDRVTVSIKDEGIGISEEDQESLFERFFRSNNVAHIQGTGLGLNIVKRYIDILNGEISFTSNIGKGSTFTFWLPLALKMKNQ
jgi:PAS domain S-box-containing protein